MKTLVCSQPWSLAYHTATEPNLQKGRAIVRIKRVGICGTDLHAFEGTQPFFNYPRILGHELSGELIACDGNPEFRAGELVSFIPYYHCGTCIACRVGKTNCCVKMQVCGVHVDGGMAEYLSVRSSALLHNQGLSLDEMALVEPMAIGAHGVGLASIKPGEFVLIIGAGPIGLAAMEFARLAGGNVIALDVNEQRLLFCKTALHVSCTVNRMTDHILSQLQEITHGDMPTVVIDASGNLGAINEAFQYMAHGGRYVLIGLQKGDISFSHPEFHKREGVLMSSRNAIRSDFELVIRSMKNKQINPASFITHRTGFDEAAKEFRTWLDPASRVIKAIIEFP